MQPYATPQIPDRVLRVTEPELQEKLPVFLDRVLHEEEELVVVRDGEPIVAVVCMAALWALRHAASEFVEQLGEERLNVLLGEIGQRE